MKRYLSNAAKAMQSGFTLVELLIVIAILGIIATIVIAAINPIEQANRANDAGLKADASQIVSAIERYYASHNFFPWNADSCTTNGGSQCIIGANVGPDTVFPFITADDASVGICGANGTACRTTPRDGELVAALELQKVFLNKSWVGVNNDQGRLWVGKAGGASATVYVCWSPKSNSNRQVLIKSVTTPPVKMYDATKAFGSSGLPTPGTCDALDSPGWTTGACVECVPE